MPVSSPNLKFLPPRDMAFRLFGRYPASAERPRFASITVPAIAAPDGIGPPSGVTIDSCRH